MRRTRLLEEFLERLDPAEGFQVAITHCQLYGETMAYLPLQSLLQELLGGEVSGEQIAARFTQGGYRADDAARLAGQVLATVVPGDATATARNILASESLFRLSIVSALLD